MLRDYGDVISKYFHSRDSRGIRGFSLTKPDIRAIIDAIDVAPPEGRVSAARAAVSSLFARDEKRVMTPLLEKGPSGPKAPRDKSSPLVPRTFRAGEHVCFPDEEADNLIAIMFPENAKVEG